jgi:hypothetical protein
LQVGGRAYGFVTPGRIREAEMGNHGNIDAIAGCHNGFVVTVMRNKPSSLK